MSSYAMRWMPSSLVNTILEGDVDKRSNFPCRGRSPEGDGSEKFPKWLYGNALIINRLTRMSLSAVRVKIVHGLVRAQGMPIAEVARQVGISTSGVSEILSRSLSS
jgi:hypothetical protein